MSFQTIFYVRSTGAIISVIRGKYIRSKAEKLRLFPGYPPSETGFLYFPSDLPVDPSTHRVKYMGPAYPAIVVEERGIPLIYTAYRQPFLEAKKNFKNIVCNMADGIGDNLFRVSAVVEAQKQYPDLAFFCAVYPREREIMGLCPDIKLFSIPDGHFRPLDMDLAARGLDPSRCGHIILDGGHYWDPRGAGFSKSALYGLFLDLPYVAYNTRLMLPPGFAQGFASFAAAVGLREDGRNVVFQLRTRNTDDRGWQIFQVLQLTSLVKAAFDCSIFYLGDPVDMPRDAPGIVNLCGRTTWLQTVYILTQACRIICCDSAVLHLCRGLSIPYFCLWGQTDPLRTLGIPPGPHDIGSALGTPQSLMSRITPAQVFNTAFVNVPFT